MHDESGSLPPFPDDVWEEKMKAAYGDDGPPVATLERDEDTPTLGEALGLPQPMIEADTDLWPGYGYKLKLKQLEQVIPLVQKVDELIKSGDVLEGMKIGAEVLAVTAFHLEGPEPRPVTKDEVLEAFDEDELAAILTHILSKQGLKVEGPNSQSGRWTGLKSFHSSAASTVDTLSNPVENSPLPSSED